VKLAVLLSGIFLNSTLASAARTSPMGPISYGEAEKVFTTATLPNDPRELLGTWRFVMETNNPEYKSALAKYYSDIGDVFDPNGFANPDGTYRSFQLELMNDFWTGESEFAKRPLNYGPGSSEVYFASIGDPVTYRIVGSDLTNGTTSVQYRGFNIKCRVLTFAHDRMICQWTFLLNEGSKSTYPDLVPLVNRVVFYTGFVKTNNSVLRPGTKKMVDGSQAKTLYEALNQVLAKREGGGDYYWAKTVFSGLLECRPASHSKECNLLDRMDSFTMKSTGGASAENILSALATLGFRADNNGRLKLLYSACTYSSAGYRCWVEGMPASADPRGP
jgi:hypothetical protein